MLVCGSGIEGNLIHPQLLKRYQTRAALIIDYIEQTAHYRPKLYAYFEVVLAAVATGRRELIRRHRTGDIDDKTLHELDLGELSEFQPTRG